jgi:hypothetical protein
MPQLQCDENVKDKVTADTQDRGQIISEVQVRFNGSTGGEVGRSVALKEIILPSTGAGVSNLLSDSIQAN